MEGYGYVNFKVELIVKSHRTFDEKNFGKVKNLIMSPGEYKTSEGVIFDFKESEIEYVGIDEEGRLVAKVVAFNPDYDYITEKYKESNPESGLDEIHDPDRFFIEIEGEINGFDSKQPTIDMEEVFVYFGESGENECELEIECARMIFELGSGEEESVVMTISSEDKMEYKEPDNLIPLVVS